MRILSEDQVRDKALRDTGQLTSFNVLGQNFSDDVP